MIEETEKVEICPICGSKKIDKLTEDTYRCKSCGQWFKVTPRFIVEEPREMKPKEVREIINWDLVENQKKINKGDRLNWKEVLGITLTKVVANLKSKGYNSNKVYDYICNKYPTLTSEHKRRLKIGIAARFGEIDSEKEASHSSKDEGG